MYAFYNVQYNINNSFEKMFSQKNYTIIIGLCCLRRLDSDQRSDSEPKEYSATMQNSAIVLNSASVPNLDDASGHKAIKIKKLRNLFKLNSMKAKLKQTTTVANYRPVTHTREKCGGRYEIQKPSTSRTT